MRPHSRISVEVTESGTTLWYHFRPGTADVALMVRSSPRSVLPAPQLPHRGDCDPLARPIAGAKLLTSLRRAVRWLAEARRRARTRRIAKHILDGEPDRVGDRLPRVGADAPGELHDVLVDRARSH